MIDPELASWQQEWRAQSEQLPDLKKKIERQDRRGMLQASLVGALLILSLATVWHFGTSLSRGFATGAWFSCVIMGVYVWRARRGTWEPASQTTAAYLALLHQRAVAKLKIVQFAFRFLLVMTFVYAGFLTLRFKHFSAMSAVVLATLVGELFLFRSIERKRRRQVEATRKMLLSVEESSPVSSRERQD